MNDEDFGLKLRKKSIGQRRAERAEVPVEKLRIVENVKYTVIQKKAVGQDESGRQLWVYILKEEG